MRFEWMEFFLQNIVQYNPTGKIPVALINPEARVFLLIEKGTC
jgi:hypothetical protein